MFYIEYYLEYLYFAAREMALLYPQIGSLACCLSAPVLIQKWLADIACKIVDEHLFQKRIEFCHHVRLSDPEELMGPRDFTTLWV
jgi:hypothetical protein